MTHRDRQPGLGLTLIGAIIAFVAALVAYLWQDSGVAGTAGAALALAGRGRIEGGVGFLGGVVTKRFPFVPGVGPFPPPYSGLPFVPCVPER